LLDTFKKLKSSDVWKTLEDHWKLYQKKYWNKVNDQDENLYPQEEECEESDDNDWKIEMMTFPKKQQVMMMKKEGQEID
jgi:hypothetical protein